MPRAVKTDQVLKLEAKLSKLKKIEKSLRKQLKKQRHDDKVSKQKIRRDEKAAIEKMIEQTAFKELTMLSSSSGLVRPVGSSCISSATAIHGAINGKNKLSMNPRGHVESKVSIEQEDMGDDASNDDPTDDELSDVMQTVNSCKTQCLNNMLNEAESVMQEAESMLAEEAKTDKAFTLDNSASSSKSSFSIV